jgi:maltooligosyltrehalose trehalohydrolase
VADLAAAFERVPAERFVFCAQNHDQVGNRARGDRLSTHLLPLATACLLFAPQVPLIFMGQEYGETNPFQFFTDHLDPAIAEATRQGRREEFASFADFSAQELPDPQARATFERSKLDHRGDESLRRLVAELIAARVAARSRARGRRGGASPARSARPGRARRRLPTPDGRGTP